MLLFFFCFKYTSNKEAPALPRMPVTNEGLGWDPLLGHCYWLGEHTLSFIMFFFRLMYVFFCYIGCTLLGPRMPVVANQGLIVGIPQPKNVIRHPGGDDCMLAGG